jgi:predicted house-cleaning noncanonical NTP pyrophosphatase (MazG superfamily)
VNRLSKIKYNKLVRDKIPEIIEKSDEIPIIKRISSDKEFLFYLSKKLIEEATEFSEKFEIEELADIYELILTILDLKNITFQELENIRQTKQKMRGSFINRIVLLSKKPK